MKKSKPKVEKTLCVLVYVVHTRGGKHKASAPVAIRKKVAPGPSFLRFTSKALSACFFALP